jgi:hypothetical protein
MRIALCLALLALASPLMADGFEPALEVPSSIDVAKRRQELLGELPNLEDTSSRKSITKYRQDLERFNTLFIKGFLAEINSICLSMNDLERATNRAWANGDMSKNRKNEIDEAISSERQKCSDRYARDSPYFNLYYELIEIYTNRNTESAILLSECNSDDSCRQS